MPSWLLRRTVAAQPGRRKTVLLAVPCYSLVELGKYIGQHHAALGLDDPRAWSAVNLNAVPDNPPAVLHVETEPAAAGRDNTGDEPENDDLVSFRHEDVPETRLQLEKDKPDDPLTMHMEEAPLPPPQMQ